jgi:TPR repeat protein
VRPQVRFESAGKAGRADRGHARAQFLIGSMYRTATGVAHDSKTALAWFKSAAELELPQAQVMLGRLFAEGIGIARDDVQALLWHERAREWRNTEQISKR